MNNTVLDPSLYQHPLDKKALTNLKKIPLLDTIVRQIINISIKITTINEYRGNTFEVTERSCPRVWKLAHIAKDRLSLNIDVPIFIKREWEYNAFTTGVDSPILVLNSGLVENYTDKELLFIIGHEMGHICNEHVLYHTLVQILKNNLLRGTTITGAVLSTSAQMGFLYWSRKSELTADRAGLIACQDKNSALSGLFKLMGLPEDYLSLKNVSFSIQDALDQYKLIQESNEDSKMTKLYYLIQTAFLDHPWTTERIYELQNWNCIERN